MNHKIFTKTLLISSLLALVSFSANMAEAARGQVLIKGRLLGSFPKSSKMPSVSNIAIKPTVINFVDTTATSKQDQINFTPNSAVSIKNFNSLATLPAGATAIPGITSIGTIGPASSFIDPISLYPINTIGVGYAALTGVSSGITAQGNALLVSPTVPLTILTPSSTGKFIFDPTIASSNTGKISLTSGGVITNLDVSPYAPTGTATTSTANIVPNSSSNKLMGTGMGIDVSTTYFITDYFAAEGSIGMIYNKYKTNATIAGAVPTGSIRTIPLTFTAQFHPYEGHKFSPYLGVGLAYMNVSDPSHSSIIPSGLAKVAQGGMDFLTDDGFGFTVDVKKYFMKTTSVTVQLNNGNVVTNQPTTINYSPIVISAGLVFRL